MHAMNNYEKIFYVKFEIYMKYKHNAKKSLIP